MPIIVADTPRLYLPQEDVILSYRGGKETSVPLKELVAGLADPDLRELTKLVLSRVLAKAMRLGIPFKLLKIKQEQDMEIPTWTYAVIQVDLKVTSELFPEVEELFLQEGYQGLKVEEAIKVLLCLENV